MQPISSNYNDFIEIIKVVLKVYQKDTSKGYIKEILTRTIRMIESVSPMDVSMAAQAKADEMNLKPLYEYGWLEQNTKRGMKDYDRSIFHWEHFYPINQQINDLLALKEITDASIYNIISKGKVCWILKNENRELDRIAKSIRPNPVEAYEKANIILLGEKKRF